MTHNYRIRGTQQDNQPHAACPQCYLDATTPDTNTLLLEFRCPRGHTFHQTRSVALHHAQWITRYAAGVQENR